MIGKIVFSIFSAFLLIYLLLPGPSQINDFAKLPNSTKSNLDGDTWQVPNVVGYFSDDYRNFVTNFYYQNYRSLTRVAFSPVKLNHPPEYAFTAIKKYTESTYLEEYVYPLRDSLFVNGFEPINPDGTQRYPGAKILENQGREFHTKTTLRFYPSPVWARVFTWVGIELSVLLLWIGYKKLLYV